MTITGVRPPATLDTGMLARFDQRAQRLDRDNAASRRDIEELQSSGYLRSCVPVEAGGSGLDLAAVNRLQRRVAYVAPATAEAVHMHHAFVGLCADLHRAGDRRGEWLLARAAEGAIFAAGHGEAGNDIPLLLSASTAQRVAGGWEITGQRIFASACPVSNYLGVHAMDLSEPMAPTVVHGFLRRRPAGARGADNRQPVGGGGCGSPSATADRAFLPDETTIAVCPTGPAGPGPFQVGMLAWVLLGSAAVQASIAERAFDDTVAHVDAQAPDGAAWSTAQRPEVRRRVAEMRSDLELLTAHLDTVCDEWATGADHGSEWPSRIVACMDDVVTRARSVRDLAVAVGGAGHEPCERRRWS